MNSDRKIKTVAVYGAGSVGAYVLYGLKDIYQDNLWVIAEGERAERYERDGFVINDVPYQPNIKTPDQAQGVDLLIVAVKYGALDSILPSIKKIVKDNTTVMSLMNGVDTEIKIGKVIPKNQIIHSLIRISSRHTGNRIDFTPLAETMGIYYGLPEMAKKEQDSEPDGDRLERLEAVKECFQASKLINHMSQDIMKDIWMKYALNISHNIPQAILGAGIGIYYVSPHAAFLGQALRSEVVALAACYGIDISEKDVNTGSGKNGFESTARFSTLQDLDAKRKTEIEMFCGTVMRMGEEEGLSVPYNTFAYHVIKGLEEKNEGRYDFK